MAHSQFALLRQRRFLPFFLTQALGAFNDNVFKQAFVILITVRIVGLSDDEKSLWSNLAAGVFILPFFLFSANAGQWAETFEKALTEAIEESLSSLKEREAKILRLYFGLDGEEPAPLAADER